MCNNAQNAPRLQGFRGFKMTYNFCYNSDGHLISTKTYSFNNPSLVFKYNKEAHSVKIQQVEKMKIVGEYRYYRVDF